MDEDNVAAGAGVESGTTATDKVHSQDELQRIVKREKAEVEERIRREMEAKFAQEINSLKAQQPQSTGLGGMKEPVNVDEIYSKLEAKFEKQMAEKQAKMEKDQHDASMQRVADNYFAKLKSAGERYNDFDEIVGDFEHENFPQLVYHLSGMENAGDVIYELNKNPAKLEQIDYWLNKSPQKGLRMLHSLADSIKDNYTAQTEYTPTTPPLSQIKQSNVGMNNGSMSLEDLKQADFNRF